MRTTTIPGSATKDRLVHTVSEAGELLGISRASRTRWWPKGDVFTVTLLSAGRIFSSTLGFGLAVIYAVVSQTLR